MKNLPPALPLAVRAILAAALLAVSPARDVKAEPPASRSFLEIARDKNASPAQKKSIAVIMAQTEASSPEAAEKKLKASPDLIFYGDEEAFLTDISPLASFTQAETVVLYNNKISDLTPLAGFNKVRRLRLERNAITDITPLRSLTQLESLQITDNAISDIGALSGLKSLRSLWLSDNKIRDIAPLAGLGLRDLYLSGNPIEDLSPLGKIDTSDIRLQNCGLTDISALRGLAQTAASSLHLDLSKNRITDIEPLSRLTKISSLDLSSNQISDVAPLAKSTVIYLDLHDNQITDVSPLAKMPLLQSLDVRGNPIRDYALLVELQKSREGIKIVADKGFEAALSKSLPPKKDLQNLPIIGCWLSDPVETEMFGTLRVEMTFEDNGQLTTRMRPPELDKQWLMGDSPANPPMRSTYRVEGNLFIDEATGQENAFEIKGDTLILVSGTHKTSFHRHAPGKPGNLEKALIDTTPTSQPVNRPLMKKIHEAEEPGGAAGE